MNSTLKYYADNARDFFDNTHDKDMDEIYRKFLPLLPKKSYILDAGCGSGRDSLYFLSQGYSVDAIDASAEMAALATTHIRKKVKCLAFDEIETVESYEAVWAAASLLHIPYTRLPKTFSRLAKTLKEDGILYASFKYGEGEYVKEGRHFTCLNEARTTALLQQIDGLQLQRLWLSDDVRQERKGEKWLNLIAKKERHDDD